MEKKKWFPILNTLLPYSFGLFVVLFFFIHPPTNSKQSQVKITMPGGVSLQLDLTNQKISLESILDEIEPDSREEKVFLALLEDKRIYKINDSALVEALKKTTFNEPIAKGIRELWKNLEGPFNYEKEEVAIEIDPSLAPGEAKVCTKSPLRGLDLRIFKKYRGIEVTVNKNFVCPQLATLNNTLFISPKDAHRLLIKAGSVFETVTVQATFKNLGSSLPAPSSI